MAAAHYPKDPQTNITIIEKLDPQAMLILLFIATCYLLDNTLKNLLQNNYPQYKRKIISLFILFFISIYPLQHSLTLPLSLYLVINLFLATLLFLHLYKIESARRLFILLGKRVTALDHFISNKTLIIALCSSFLATALFLSYKLFGGIPHIQDSAAQYSYAKVLLNEWRFVMKAHPYQHFFPFENGVINGQYFSNFYSMDYFTDEFTFAAQYPPGHSMLLAIGMLLGLPQLVNPFLGATNAVITYFLAKELFDQKTARIAVIFASVSPFILFMSSEYMNHATALLCTTSTILFFARTIAKKNIFDAVLCAIFLGLLFITRPLNAVALAFSLLIFFVFFRKESIRLYSKHTVCGALTFLPFIVIQGLQNYQITGNALLYAYRAATNDLVLLGSLFDKTNFFQQLVAYAASTSNNLVGLNLHLFELSIPSVLIVLTALLTRKDSDFKHVILILIVCLMQILAYLFYYFQDWCFGPRDLYELSGILCILSARGILNIIHISKNNKNGLEGDNNNSLLAKGIIIFILIITFSTSLIERLPSVFRTYQSSYWRVENQYLATLEKKFSDMPGKYLVFVDSNFTNVATTFPFADDQKVVYARHLSKKNRFLIEYYKDRIPYFADHRGNIRPKVTRNKKHE